MNRLKCVQRRSGPSSQIKGLKVLHNRRGVSLVSMMIATAAMAGLFVVANQTLIQSSEMSASADQRQGLVSQFENIRLMAQGLDLCTQVMAAGNLVIVPGGAVDVPSLTIGTHVLRPETRENLTIDTLRLVDEVALPNAYDSGGVLRGHRRVRLEMAGQLAAKKNYAFRKSFRMDVLVDGGNKVIDCYRGQNSPKVACETLGGTFSNSPAPGCDMANRFGLQSVTCPANKCVVGFDSNNVPVCGDI